MAKTTERSEPDFAAFIGIDWADQRHTWALQTTIQEPPEPGDLDHTPEAADAWATELGRRFGGRPIAIARAVAWLVALHAHQVSTFRAVPNPPSHTGQLSQRLSAVWSQE